MSGDAVKRRLREFRARVLTNALLGLGEIQAALVPKGYGSREIENLAVLAMEQARLGAEVTNNPRGHPTLGVDQEWIERQEAAINEAEADFAGIVNYVVALREGEEEGEES